jgi:hypothetical protein
MLKSKTMTIIQKTKLSVQKVISVCKWQGHSRILHRAPMKLRHKAIKIDMKQKLKEVVSIYFKSKYKNFIYIIAREPRRRFDERRTPPTEKDSNKEWLFNAVKKDRLIYF